MASECALKKGDLVTLVPDAEGRINGHMPWGLKVRINSWLIGTVGTVSCPLVESGDVKVDLLPICRGMVDNHGEPEDSKMDPVYVSPECVKPVEGGAFVCKTVDSYAVFDRKDIKKPAAEFSTALFNARDRAELVCSELLEDDTPAAPRDRFTIERNNYNISVIDNSIPEHNVILCLTNDYKAGTLDAETIANSLCAMLNAGCGEVSDAFVSMVGGKKGNP